jgi:hypothetical protein
MFKCIMGLMVKNMCFLLGGHKFEFRGGRELQIKIIKLSLLVNYTFLKLKKKTTNIGANFGP